MSRCGEPGAGAAGRTPKGGVYRPRNPRASPLYQCADRHLAELRSEGRLQRLLEERVIERFVKCGEAPGPIDASYEDATRAIADQKKGIAFCILDDEINAIENWQRCVRSDQPPESAPDVRTLGRKLGFDGDAAQRTIDEYNRACPSGNFNPRTLDGLATVGLSPVKSNCAVPLDSPPYHAYPVISSNTFTFGGLKVNVNAQVVNKDGDAMPGLYAAGETVGLYYGKYPGATSVLRGAVFGRRAGEHAGAQAVAAR